jgi:hypothetical protein
MRAAVMTANLLVMQAANKQDMTPEEFSQIIQGLMTYLKTSSDAEDEIGREALAKLKKGE